MQSQQYVVSRYIKKHSIRSAGRDVRSITKQSQPSVKDEPAFPLHELSHGVPCNSQWSADSGSRHPRLYWNDGYDPESAWLKFTKEKVPRDKLYTAMDDEVLVSPVLGLPGGDNLGLGRHWHFFSIIFWVLRCLLQRIPALAVEHTRVDCHRPVDHVGKPGRCTSPMSTRPKPVPLLLR